MTFPAAFLSQTVMTAITQLAHLSECGLNSGVNKRSTDSGHLELEGDRPSTVVKVEGERSSAASAVKRPSYSYSCAKKAAATQRHLNKMCHFTVETRAVT